MRPRRLCVLLVALCLPASGCGSAGGQTTDTRPAPSAEEQPNAPTLGNIGSGLITSFPPASASSPYAAQVKPLVQYTSTGGQKHKYVEIAPGLDTEAVIALARRLHRLEPTTWHWFVDDASGAPQLISELELQLHGVPAVGPRDWLQRHTVAYSFADSGRFTLNRRTTGVRLADLGPA